MINASSEVIYKGAKGGVPMLMLGILLLFTLFGIPVAIFIFCGLVLVNPNQARVVLLFGIYKGTLREAGFYWVNPFSNRRPVSLRAHNFNSEHLKVNDLRGNPIEIGAVVVWRVRNTAQAVFDVEDHQSYVEVQTESALRHLASLHPYDTPHENETSLRGSSDAINQQFQIELEQRLARAGIEVLEG
ncbi:MAG TPA: SPFH domain-containing protein, partial [Planctomycetes bacterium]|nr:SPFH domain-containing protein [Planctomycetota bacterium]